MSTKNRNKIIITPEEAGERLDSLLCTLYPGLSRSRIQKEIKNGCILVNKAVAKPSKILKIEDEIDISIEEPAKIEILPENLPLKILYEDEKCAVILKPKNMLTHPTAKETSGTLGNALLYHFKTLSDCNGEFRPGIVHRLDRNTSGLLLIAKTNDSYENLKLQMQNRTIEKRYYAVVSGNFENEEGTISKILTTNCIYQTPELLSREWYINVDVAKYTAYFIDRLNHDSSISDLLNPYKKIEKCVEAYKNR